MYITKLIRSLVNARRPFVRVHHFLYYFYVGMPKFCFLHDGPDSRYGRRNYSERNSEDTTRTTKRVDHSIPSQRREKNNNNHLITYNRLLFYYIRLSFKICRLFQCRRSLITGSFDTWTVTFFNFFKSVHVVRGINTETDRRTRYR